MLCDKALYHSLCDLCDSTYTKLAGCKGAESLRGLSHAWDPPQAREVGTVTARDTSSVLNYASVSLLTEVKKGWHQEGKK